MSLQDLPPAPPLSPPASPMRRWLRALEMTAPLGDHPNRIFADVIDDLAGRHDARPALLSRDEVFSFAELAARARRYSRWGLERGLRPGDTVGLLMPNRPDYVAAWVGLSRIGCVVALLNTNLVGASLAHCIAAVAPKLAIVADRLMPAFAGALPDLDAPPPCWVHGHWDTAAAPTVGDVCAALNRQDDGPFAAGDLPAVTLDDAALYIYTSGTTGLPKAARVSHRRILMWSFWFAGLIGTTPDDRIYDCLPLYHSVGGIVAVGSLLVGGGSVVIREKFSASQFWDEIRRWDCTLFQYIGELCRYLVAAPPRPDDANHRLRLVCGNGLGADIWPALRQRFGIPEVLEFYAATEGNFSLFNVEGRIGSIGRIPSFLAHRFPAAVVKFDVETGQPMRDERGLCLRCARNEAGEAIGLISDGAGSHGGAFEGYSRAQDTDRKVLRDVFTPGDRWFRTGDLMRIDERGFYYFVDRIGDTFRWKGENVATSEVAAAILAYPGIVEAHAYGVVVPGADGKAGMAALVTGEGFSPAGLRAHLLARLPAYARPVFLRLQREIAVTETFKHKSGALARDGFDPAIIADPLFFDDPVAEAYVPLDDALHAAIIEGRVRV